MSTIHAPIHHLAVRLGLFAVLFQAILFGWHHHDSHFAGHLPVAVVENPSALLLPAGDEDHCDVCQVLHHLGAAPVDFAAARALLPAAAPLVFGDAITIAATLPLAFRARAPPPA